MLEQFTSSGQSALDSSVNDLNAIFQLVGSSGGMLRFGKAGLIELLSSSKKIAPDKLGDGVCDEMWIYSNLDKDVLDRGITPLLRRFGEPVDSSDVGPRYIQNLCAKVQATTHLDIGTFVIKSLYYIFTYAL